MRCTQLYVESCPSTNDFLKEASPLEYPMAVYTFDQTHGRGQLERKWESRSGENIAISFGIPRTLLSLSPVELSMFTANMVRAFLSEYLSDKVSIKWPNDIFARDKKLAGILIEKEKDSVIIGIGINVNQILFENLPHAASMRILTQKEFDLRKLSEDFISHFESLFPIENISEIPYLYEYHLWKKGKRVHFRIEELVKKGTPISVNEKGELGILLEGNSTPFFFPHGTIQWVLE